MNLVGRRRPIIRSKDTYLDSRAIGVEVALRGSCHSEGNQPRIALLVLQNGHVMHCPGGNSAMWRDPLAFTHVRASDVGSRSAEAGSGLTVRVVRR
jgi:hypothetical protein